MDLVKIYNRFMEIAVFETFLKIVFKDKYYGTPGTLEGFDGNCAKLVIQFAEFMEKHVQDTEYEAIAVPATYDDGSGHICLKVSYSDYKWLVDPVHDVLICWDCPGRRFSPQYGSRSLVGTAYETHDGTAYNISKKFGNVLKPLYQIDHETFTQPERFQDEVEDWSQKFLDLSYVTTRVLFARKFVWSWNLPKIIEVFSDGTENGSWQRVYTPYGIEPKIPVGLEGVCSMLRSWHFQQEHIEQATTEVKNAIKEHGCPTTIV